VLRGLFVADSLRYDCDVTQNTHQYGAFYSYVRSDDRNEGGRITDLRERLSAELEVQIGHEFPIFQDRNDILVGERWNARIRTALENTTLLISIVTPAYLRSEACREEVRIFLDQERRLGRDDLIIPVLYVPTPQLSNSNDEIAQTLSVRQHVDWTRLRLEDIDSSLVRKEISKLAAQIVETLGRPSTPLARIDDSIRRANETFPERAELGFVELLADTEEALPILIGSIVSVTEQLDEFTEIVESGKVEIESASQSRKPSAAKLVVIRQISKSLETPVTAIEQLVVEYVHQLDRVGGGVSAIAERISATGEMEEISAAERLLASLEALVSNAGESLDSLQELRQTLAGSYTLSSTMRPVLKRMNSALAKMLPSRREFERWRDDVADALGQSTIS